MYIFFLVLLAPVVMWFRAALFFYIVLFPLDKVITYTKKINQLRHLAAMKHGGVRSSLPLRTRLSVYYTCLCMIAHHIYICWFQLFNKSVVKITKNKYEVTYMLNNNMYKMLITTTMGPQPKIIQALNEVDHDITDTIIPYLGPAGNFHGLKYKPADFNINILTLNMSDARELTFTANDEIVLNII